jgi:hypothetical protein
VKASNRQFLIKVDGIDGLFAQKTGGEVTSDTNTVWDGGSQTPDLVAAPAATSDVVLTRPYDPDAHQEVLNNLVAKVGTWRTTITLTPTYSDLSAARVKPRVYSNALLKGVREPEPDASSGDASDFELTFAVSAPA